LINSFVFAFTDRHEVVTQQMRLDFYHYPEGYLQTYRDKLAAVTADDVLRVAQTYLHPDRQNLVLVGKTGSFEAQPETLGLPVRTITPQSR
jgi:zinc protease